ncbi:FAD-dependent monooxygenase, partial [Acinetobacter baumannii]
QQYGKDDSEYINSISRKALNQLLIDHAEKTERVRFHFNHRAQGFDSLRNSVSIVDENDKSPVELLADIVIGCDGAASAIRNQLSAE